MDRSTESRQSDKQRFFDCHAASWDGESTALAEEKRLRVLVREMGLTPGGLVIEPGCGTGMVSALLIEELGAAGLVAGFDISGSMLALASRKGLGPRAVFCRTDAACLPFGSRSADAVVCFRVFPHLDDRTAALAEFSRVLRERGLLVIAHPAGRQKLNEYHSRAGGEVALDLLPEEPEMRSCLAASGFEVVLFEDRDERYLVRALKRG
jgi:ubiquinone/menaquinone biosynthesis C-methylase UbiE